MARTSDSEEMTGEGGSDAAGGLWPEDSVSGWGARRGDGQAGVTVGLDGSVAIGTSRDVCRPG